MGKKFKYYGVEESWKDSARRKKSQEGYSDVTYEDTWGLDVTLSKIIAKHLRAFLAASKGPYGGTPSKLCTRYGDRAIQEWHNIIRKMIYAFEEYKRKPDIGLNDDIDEDGRDGEATGGGREAFEAEHQKRIKEGMQLFIDYYERLWW